MASGTLRTALYARVSTEQRAKANTISSQVDALRQRIEQDGLGLDPELVFVDDGYSGEALERPALERLRDQAAAGAVDRVYVLSPDRLARKYAYQVLLVEELQRAGTEVVFLNHPVDPTPEGSCSCRSRASSPSTSGRRSWSGAAAGSAAGPGRGP